MNRKRVRQLEAQRDARLRHVMDALLTDPDRDVSAEIGRLEAYDRLLTAIPRSRWRELAWAGFVAIVCVSLLGVGLSARVPTTRLVLSVTAGTSTFALTGPWRWVNGRALDTDSLSLKELVELELPPTVAHPARSSDGNAWLDIGAAAASVTALRLDGGSTVTVEVGEEGDHLDVYVRGGSLAGDVSVRGAARITTGIGMSDEGVTSETEFPIPEVVSFRSAGHSVVPAQLRVRLRGDALELYDVHVRTLSFAREIPAEPGGIEFVSTIDEGHLTLTDIGKTVALRRDERLALRGVAGRIPRLSIGDRIELVFEGTAKEVLLGPGGFERNLTPTLLEYLYHNQRVVFLWSALAFVWGFVWSARRMLFS